jgi:hypothetical protein
MRLYILQKTAEEIEEKSRKEKHHPLNAKYRVFSIVRRRAKLWRGSTDTIKKQQKAPKNTGFIAEQEKCGVRTNLQISGTATTPRLQITCEALVCTTPKRL